MGCVYILTIYSRNETLVYQQASFHQLHYPHPSQQLDKAFPYLHDVTCSIRLYVHVEIITMCIEHAMVANYVHITHMYKGGEGV